MPDLVQIRQGFRATWNDLTLSVESEDRQWTLQVRGADGRRVLYTAGRSNRAAAQAAGLEFVLWSGPAPAPHASPEALARGLEWQAYW